MLNSWDHIQILKPFGLCRISKFVQDNLGVFCGLSLMLIVDTLTNYHKERERIGRCFVLVLRNDEERDKEKWTLSTGRNYTTSLGNSRLNKEMMASLALVSSCRLLFINWCISNFSDMRCTTCYKTLELTNFLGYFTEDVSVRMVTPVSSI